MVLVFSVVLPANGHSPLHPLQRLVHLWRPKIRHQTKTSTVCKDWPMGLWKLEKNRDLNSSQHDDLPGTVFRSSDNNKVRLYNQNFLLHTTHRQACFRFATAPLSFHVCPMKHLLRHSPARLKMNFEPITKSKQTKHRGELWVLCANILPIFLQGFAGKFISYFFGRYNHAANMLNQI